MKASDFKPGDRVRVTRRRHGEDDRFGTVLEATGSLHFVTTVPVRIDGPPGWAPSPWFSNLYPTELEKAEQPDA